MRGGGLCGLRPFSASGGVIWDLDGPATGDWRPALLYTHIPRGPPRKRKLAPLQARRPLAGLRCLGGREGLSRRRMVPRGAPAAQRPGC